MGGTSVAAPAVTGISALLIESYRCEYLGDCDNDEIPLPSTIKALLIHSAREMGLPGPDFIFGWGGVDAEAAVDLIENHLVIEDRISEAEEDVFYCLVPDDAREFKATLVWDDPPGTSLINQLDVVLSDPNGDLHYPWVLDPDNPAIWATTGVDSRNNVEQVRAWAPMSGLWEVRVNGSKAKYLEQNYSLVTDFHVGPREKNFEYAAKVICGIQKDSNDLRLAQGSYATTINVHNPNKTTVSFYKKLALAYPPGQQRPGRIIPISFDALGPDQALTLDCVDIQRRLFPEGLPRPYLEGFVIIQSAMLLDVSVVYSAADLSGEIRSIDVEQIRERDYGYKPLPDLIVLPGPDDSYCTVTEWTDEYGFASPGSLWLIATFKNQGSAYSGPFDVELEIERTTGPRRGDIYTYTESVSGLVEDEVVDVTFTIPAAHSLDFKLTIDVNADVTESNEGNNTVYGSCHVD